jgi:ribonuclease D
MSLLQIASNDLVLIIDTFRLRENPEVCQFLTKLFTSKIPIKLGHSVGMDMSMIRQTFKFPHGFEGNVKSLVDLVPLFSQIASSNKVALSVMCKEILGKELSKLEQVGDWDSRPLRESQMHYAGMDAFVLLPLYQKITDKIEGYVESEHISQCDSSMKGEMDEERSTQASQKEEKPETKVEGKLGEESKMEEEETKHDH